MDKKLVLSDICRDLLLDRKNRALLLYSESCKKNLPLIYNFVCKHLDSDADTIDQAIKSFSTEEIIVFNDMLQGVISLCKDEWVGDHIPVEVIDDESQRKRCSLCNQPNNKWVYNIKNKLNGRKMNVGSTCIGEFPTIELMKGKTRTQLEKEAEKLSRMKSLTLKFPGIEKTLEQWESTIYSFEILIPHTLEQPYLEIGKKIEELKNEYLNKKVDDSVFLEIEKLLVERKKYLQAMEEYVEEYKEERYVATSKIVSWLKSKGDLQTLETLKETGFITYRTAPKIHERSFLEKIIEDMNFLFADSGLEITDLDYNQDGFVIKPFVDKNFRLICPFGNFLSYFSWVLFGEKQTAAFNIKNIFKVSDIYDKSSVELAIAELKKVLNQSRSLFSIQIDKYTDYYEENIIDIYDKRKNKVWVVNLKKFLKEFKSVAFGITEVDDDDMNNYLTGLSKSEYKCYTIKELREIREAAREMHKVKF
jgi:hypothetical protein